MKMNASAEPEKQTQNKPNTKPIQSQTNPIPEKPKMNVTSILTKDYENKPPSSPKKTKPIQTQSNPISPSKKPRSDSFRRRATKNYTQFH